VASSSNFNPNPACETGAGAPQYLERSLLEKAGLPRLSLFYMR
jgi:hypothetical protein